MVYDHGRNYIIYYVIRCTCNTSCDTLLTLTICHNKRLFLQWFRYWAQTLWTCKGLKAVIFVWIFCYISQQKDSLKASVHCLAYVKKTALAKLPLWVTDICLEICFALCKWYGHKVSANVQGQLSVFNMFVLDKVTNTSENALFCKAPFQHFLCWFSAAEGKAVPSLPNFGNSYHVKGKNKIRLHVRASFSLRVSLITELFHISIAGVISLPYAEIKEPFEAWLDLAAKSSRINYYHGKKPLTCSCFS